MLDKNLAYILRIYLQILVDGPMWKKEKPETTAILILPGVHQEYRIIEGIKLWPKYGKYLWIGGTRGDTDFNSKDKIVSLLGKDSDNVVFGGFASHTKEQMEQIIALLDQYPEVNHIIIATAAYHLPRCMLTLLQVLKTAGRQVLLSPWPLLNPSKNSFSDESTENFQGEIDRIQEYQEKGDVASLDTFKEYLAWRLENN